MSGGIGLPPPGVGGGFNNTSIGSEMPIGLQGMNQAGGVTRTTAEGLAGEASSLRQAEGVNAKRSDISSDSKAPQLRSSNGGGGGEPPISGSSSQWLSGSFATSLGEITDAMFKNGLMTGFKEDQNRIKGAKAELEIGLSGALLAKHSKDLEAQKEVLAGAMSFVQAGVSAGSIVANAAVKKDAIRDVNNQTNQSDAKVKDMANGLRKGPTLNDKDNAIAGDLKNIQKANPDRLTGEEIKLIKEKGTPDEKAKLKDYETAVATRDRLHTAKGRDEAIFEAEKNKRAEYQNISQMLNQLVGGVQHFATAGIVTQQGSVDALQKEMQAREQTQRMFNESSQRNAQENKQAAEQVLKTYDNILQANSRAHSFRG